MDEAARDALLDASISIFRTAAIAGAPPTANSPDKDSDAGRLVGKWLGEVKTPNGKTMMVHTEIKPDGRFANDASLDGKVILQATGVWDLDGKVLTWNYMYSSPALPEDARLDKDELVTVDAQTLVLVSKRTGQEHQFKREN